MTRYHDYRDITRLRYEPITIERTCKMPGDLVLVRTDQRAQQFGGRFEGEKG